MAIKKQWFEIVAPPFFGEKQVGETLAVEPKQLIGRAISTSLIDLDPETKKFWIKINLSIVNVDGVKARTEIIGHDTMFEHIYRMVQRHSRRVDCIQDITTNDNTKVRVKTVLIIPRRVGTSIKKAVRAKTLETTKSVVSNTDFEQFLRMVISGSLQQAIRTACKKICTVGAVEIRKSEVLGRGSKLPQMQPAELQPTPITEEPLAENPKTSS